MFYKNNKTDLPKIGSQRTKKGAFYSQHGDGYPAPIGATYRQPQKGLKERLLIQWALVTQHQSYPLSRKKSPGHTETRQQASI